MDGECVNPNLLGDADNTAIDQPISSLAASSYDVRCESGLDGECPTAYECNSEGLCVRRLLQFGQTIAAARPITAGTSGRVPTDLLHLGQRLPCLLFLFESGLRISTGELSGSGRRKLPKPAPRGVVVSPSMAAGNDALERVEAKRETGFVAKLEMTTP